MELNWSLKEIYTSFESEEFKKDLNNLDKAIENISSWANEVVKDNENWHSKMEEYIKKISSLKNLSNKLGSFINLSLTTNTKDKDALKYSDILEKKLTGLVKSSVKLERYISNIDKIDEVINKSEILEEHEFILKNIIEQSKYLLSEKEEAIIANMRNTGSNAWVKLKDNLISNLKVEIEENGEVKEIPLTVVLNMAYDKEEKIRKKSV